MTRAKAVRLLRESCNAALAVSPDAVTGADWAVAWGIANAVLMVMPQDLFDVAAEKVEADFLRFIRAERADRAKKTRRRSLTDYVGRGRA